MLDISHQPPGASKSLCRWSVLICPFFPFSLPFSWLDLYASHLANCKSLLGSVHFNFKNATNNSFLENHPETQFLTKNSLALKKSIKMLIKQIITFIVSGISSFLSYTMYHCSVVIKILLSIHANYTLNVQFSIADLSLCSYCSLGFKYLMLLSHINSTLSNHFLTFSTILYF